MNKGCYSILSCHQFDLILCSPAFFLLGLLIQIPLSGSVSSTNDNGLQRGKEMNCEKGVIAGFCENNVYGCDVASHPLIKQQPSSCRSGNICLSQHPAHHSEAVRELKMQALSNLQKT